MRLPQPQTKINQMSIITETVAGVETYTTMAESIGMALQQGRFVESGSAEDLQWMEDEFENPIGLATFAAGAMIEDEENFYA